MTLNLNTSTINQLVPKKEPEKKNKILKLQWTSLTLIFI